MPTPKIPRHIMQLLFLVLIVAALTVVVINELSWFFLLLLLLLLILLLWWLFGGVEEEPAEEASAQLQQRKQEEYPPEKFYVQNQVVLSGPEDAVHSSIEQAVATNEGIELTLNEEQRILLREAPESIRKCFSRYPDIDPDNLVIELYTIEGEEPNVAAVIQAINEIVGRGSNVRAEPNWLSGYPWEPAGSPWEPAGSPWEPAGSSDGKQNSAPATLFPKQWAFKQIGLDKKSDKSSGLNVRVGVFDTSPFDKAVSLAVAQPIPITWVRGPSPLAVNVRNYPTPPNDDEKVDLSSHGLFTAGMVHALAGNARIQILRVLNKNNFGDMFSLIWAIYQFVLDNAPGNAPKDQLGAVINMSLGIRVPPDKAKMLLPVEVQALRYILQVAHCANIVVVAAAGNNSANLPAPEPSHLPGNWSEIIGVAASNQEMNRSCFSNRGNITAPGGDGKPNEENPAVCEPGNNSCGVQDCQYSVVGPVMQNDENTGFAYWSGTSFAAPMVAGLAACVIEKGQGKLSPEQVRRIIECGATPVTDAALGVGIINVPNTLNDFDSCLERLGICLDQPKKEKEYEKEDGHKREAVKAA